MGSESYASIYGKAVREARAAERAQDESRRAVQKRKDQAEKYAYSKDPPQGHRVYRKGAMWAAETPAWGRPIDEVWGDVFYSRTAAVNAAWRHFDGEKQLPLRRRGGKGRGLGDLTAARAYREEVGLAGEEAAERADYGLGSSLDAPPSAAMQALDPNAMEEWRAWMRKKRRRGGKGRGPYNLGIAGTLTVAEVRAAAKMLRKHGFKLPRLGYTMRMPDEAPARELAHDRNGYYWVGWKAPWEPGRGGKGRKARGGKGRKLSKATALKRLENAWFKSYRNQYASPNAATDAIHAAGTAALNAGATEKEYNDAMDRALARSSGKPFKSWYQGGVGGKRRKRRGAGLIAAAKALKQAWR